MRKNGWMKSIVCFILCTAMVLGMVPPVVADAAGTPFIQASNGKTVDTPTVNDWQNIFTATSTENAGGVWVDKSVFSNSRSFNRATAENETYSVGMEDEANNFLISLSALASNKSVVGYSTIPTDTVFVLDMSSSMEGPDYNFIDDLAEATNTAIKKLLSLNKNNRIAVVLYSGAEGQNSGNTLPTRILMPLDTYTTTATGGNFVGYTTIGGEEAVRVLPGVKNSKNETNFGLSNNQSRWSSGTFTQDGIYVGANILIGADDKIISNPDNLQHGVERMPIMVLMTDGAPSVFSTDFAGTMDGNTNRRLESKYKNNTTSTGAATEFLVQLTAAWAKYKVEQAYTEHDMLFYTLGLPTDGEFSTGSLNPANPVPGSASDNGTGHNRNLTNEQFKDILDEYWTNYLEKPDTRFSNNTTSNFQIETNATIHGELKAAVTAPENNRSNGLNKYRYYADAYYQANIDTFGEAFDSIVEEIILQSKYYPTYLEENTSITDGGFLSIVDTLGDYMEVKDIKNIQLDGAPFYGRNAARELSSLNVNGPYSTIQNDLIEAMTLRLGTTRADALEVIRQAKSSGMLYYTKDTEFKNAIGWYGKYDSNSKGAEYIQPWDGKETDAQKAPAGANCTIESYYFYGMGTGTTKVGDMRHIAVEIVNFFSGTFAGQTKVRMRIPASLIPLVEYEVELDGDNLDSNVRNLDWNGETITPIRLVYEVGLKDEINSINIADSIPDSYKNADGNYEFYTNRWEYSGNLIIGVTPPSQVGHSYSYFNPSTRNEFAYYQYDEKIYVEDGNGGYILYTGAAPSGNATKFFAQRVTYKKPAAGQKTAPVPKYMQIDPSDLRSAKSIAGTNNWYIPAGTPTLMNRDRLINYKDGNTAENATGGPTQTYKTYNTQYVNNSGSGDGLNYYVEAALGNNGKLVVAPLSGIRLQKIVPLNSGITGNDPYTFTITPAQNVTLSTEGYDIYRVNGIDNDGSLTAVADGKVAPVNNVLTVTVPANQTIYIAGLPRGEYTVTETAGESYIVSAVNGNATNSNSTTTTVETGKFATTSFTNIARTTGNLTIAKEINHSLGINYVTPETLTFEMKVSLKLDNAPLAGKTYTAKQTKDSAVTEIKTDENGEFIVSLKHKDQIEIFDLPYGTVATVVENTEKLPAGFIKGEYNKVKYPLYYDNGADRAGDGVVTVASDVNASVLVVNQYAPLEVENPIISLLVNKNFTGRRWDANDSFSFQLQEWDGANWQPVKLADDTNNGVKTLTAANTTKQLDFTAEIKTERYSEVGTYYYRVVEIIPATNPILGVTYDTSIHGFAVTVTDATMDGRLEVSDVTTTPATSTSGESKVVVTSADNGYTVTADFKNTFVDNTADAHIEIQKAVINASNSPLATAEGFTFTVQPITVTAKPEGGYEIANTGNPVTTGGTSATGTVRHVLQYTDVNNEVTADAQKTLYYAVTENKPEGAVQHKPWTYSEDVNYVKVVLSRVADSHLKAETFVSKDIANFGSTGSTTALVSFTNTYTAATAALELDVNKVLTGRNMTAGEFTFTLEKAEANSHIWDADGNVVNGDKLTAVNAAANNGEQADVKFPTMYFNKVGIYGYNVTEQPGNNPNINYDKNTYQVVVRVTDGCGITAHNHANGTLPAGTLCATYEVINHADNAVVFRNTHTPAPVTATINANKSFTYTNGGTAISFPEGTFTAGLYETSDTTFAAPLQTVAFTAGDGTNAGVARFKLNYTLADIGTHTYIIRELVPAEANADNDYTFGGVKYDVTPYTVTVTVSRHDDTGVLSADVSYQTDGNAVPVIANKYTAAPVSVELSGVKHLTDTKFGNTSVKDFTFALYETDATFTVASGATPIKTENVEVKKEGDNGYKGTFTFKGINALTYNTVGTKYFVVKEQIPASADPLMIYDSNEYHITVTVTDDGSGKLAASSKVYNVALNKDARADALNFSNEKRHPDNITVGFNVEKTVIGSINSPENYEFYINEYADAGYNTKDNGVSIKTDVNGKAVKDIEFTEEHIGKTFWFEMVEKQGSDENISYDTSSYKFSVKIEVDAAYRLVAVITPAASYGDKFTVTPAAETSTGEYLPRKVTASFTNFYSAPVTIDINKTVENKGTAKLSPQGFKFVITETDANYSPLANGFTETVVTNDIGSAVFSNISVKDGQARYFTVAEKAEGKADVTYDNTVYKIRVARSAQTVTITSDPAGTQVANNISLSFNNIYNSDVPPPSSPDTGDSSMANLYMAMIATGTIGFCATAFFAVRRRKSKQG